MRRIIGVLSCVLALLAVAGCPGGGSGSAKPGGGETTPNAHSFELDRLMRTRMNASYSQLVFLVFHAEGEHDFPKIAEESGRLTDAVAAVLKLQPPPQVQSDQARQIYVDYNETLKKDNDKFAAAAVAKDFETMSSALTKIGETCSACHHFFRVKVPDSVE